MTHTFCISCFAFKKTSYKFHHIYFVESRVNRRREKLKNRTNIKTKNKQKAIEIIRTLKKFCFVRKLMNDKKKLINATKILDTFKRKRVDIVFTKLDTKKAKAIFEKLTRKIKKTKLKF